jgi:hypothetical protein
MDGLSVRGEPSPERVQPVRFADGMRRIRPRHLAGAALAVFGLTAVGCGSEDHPNEPRPPKPIEITARVDEQVVDVSPNEFGAGLANFTISNQSDSVVELTVDGPVAATSPPIEPSGVTDDFKVDLQEGEYEVTAGAESRAKPTELVIGPERPSAQDELLLP